MKVVLDTNVLISALISPHNPPDSYPSIMARRRF